MPSKKSGSPKLKKSSKIDDEEEKVAPVRTKKKSQKGKKVAPKKKQSAFKKSFLKTREKIWERKRARVKLHRSFHRSYREDYKRPLNVPNLVAHAHNTLKILIKNWRVFLPLMIFITVANILLVGLMSQNTYKILQDTIDSDYEAAVHGQLGLVAKSGLLLISTVATGGLSSGQTEIQQFCWIFLISILWLVTIYFLRHLLAGNKPKFRDGIYNALTPLLSSYVIIAVIAVHLIPIGIFVIFYSTAVATEFLSTPLYAFLFWVFGSLLILLSAYLLPVSITALVAISVPGIYPLPALHAASDLLQGRRIRFIIRLIFCIIYLAVIWVIIALPLFGIDLVLKERFTFLQSIPFVPVLLQIMTTFSFIYGFSYIYLFYRRMLDNVD